MWAIWSAHDTILHMSRQLSCRDMCKIAACLDYYNQNKNEMNFLKI